MLMSKGKYFEALMGNIWNKTSLVQNGTNKNENDGNN